MNLHSIVSSAISIVNPSIVLTIKVSTGYVTQPDGSRVPGYADVQTVIGQVQSLSANELAQIEGLNLEGEKRAIYINGNWSGVVRPDGKGGDLITFPSGSIWLVVQVIENWSEQDGWVKLIVTRQNGS